jgi:hypothetical protein
LVVVVLVAGDFAARAYAEAQTQDFVNQHSTTDLHVDVSIKSFPFLGRLAVGGEVRQVEATASDVREGPIDIHALRLVLTDVRVDRGRMLEDQRLYLRSIGGGSAVAEITDDALSDALGIPVQVVDGKLEAEVLGHRVQAEMSMRNGVLGVKVAGRTLPALTLPTTGLFPCHPDAAFAGDRIRLSCSFSEVPARFLQLVNGVTAAA